MNIEKEAKRQFQKLPKSEQKRINALNRVPTCRGTITHGHTKYCKRDRKWNARDYDSYGVPSFKEVVYG